ncbi:hypothetical protein I6I59_09290 [Campylobacter ureolyticus]|nr:hypothetical protein I6I59_09290 [Campylobacter ureolyticus]
MIENFKFSDGTVLSYEDIQKYHMRVMKMNFLYYGMRILTDLTVMI